MATVIVVRRPARLAPPPVAAAPRRTYADRIDQLADLINRIDQRRGDPFAFHAARDAAAREARAIARTLRVDGL